MSATIVGPCTARKSRTCDYGVLALGTRRGNSMEPLANAGTDDRASAAAAVAAGGAPGPAGANAMNVRALEKDEPEGDRLNERVEKRLMDIEAGKVKLNRYTLDEYMRHLDGILGK